MNLPVEDDPARTLRELAYLLDHVKGTYRTLIYCKKMLEEHPFESRTIAVVCGNCAYNLGQNIAFVDPEFKPEKI